MSTKWGQRLGNIIAIVTLLTAAGAVYALRYRHQPPGPGSGVREAGGVRREIVK